MKTKMFIRNLPVAALVAVALLSGCATTETVRPGEQVYREQIVRMGVVESVREVQVDTGQTTGVGGTVGAVIGGIAGSQIGRGSGSIVGSVLGAVLGGVAGHAADQAGGRKPGIELTIRLDDGRQVVIAQTAEEMFHPGERVRIISDGITARVSR